MEGFITFEGIEGCGKTTQMKLAGKYLKRHNISLIMTEEPGGTALGKKIREIVLNQKPFDICAEAELLLILAARAQHIREVISPALKTKKIVLCDRFSDATFAYQGFGRGLKIDHIRKLNAFSSMSVKPNLTILFDLPAEVGLKRAADRMSHIVGQAEKEDRFEHEDLQFHKRVREGYLFLAKKEPERFRIIDGLQNIKTIHHEVCSLLLPLLSR